MLKSKVMAIQKFPSALNDVVAIGPIVIKRFRRQHATRRFWSEKLTRRILPPSIRTIPILASFPYLKTIVLPRIQTIALDKRASHTFVNHTKKLTEQLLLSETDRHSYWVDSEGRVVKFPSFREFLENELKNHLKGHGAEFLFGFHHQVAELFARTPFGNKQLCCLIDVAPKNVCELNGEYIHYDLENTIIGPEEFFLARTAINVIRDGYFENSLEAAEEIMSYGSDVSLVRSSIAFTLVRMLLFNSVVPHASIQPKNALKILLEGAAISRILKAINHECL